MRANVVDVDIPEEISQFAELKTLTEDVGRNARVISGVFCKAAEWRKTDQWREGEVRSRGAQERSEITTVTISNVCPMCQTHAVQAFRSGRCFMNRSARALKWEARTETEAPYECRDPECFFFIVNEMGLRRRHMKRGHSNKSSPRHKYISVCITNIEIPEEMSVFTGLKTLTEKDSERCSDAFF